MDVDRGVAAVDEGDRDRRDYDGKGHEQAEDAPEPLLR
jgi:hypothetical protein